MEFKSTNMEFKSTTRCCCSLRRLLRTVCILAASITSLSSAFAPSQSRISSSQSSSSGIATTIRRAAIVLIDSSTSVLSSSLSLKSKYHRNNLQYLTLLNKNKNKYRRTVLDATTLVESTEDESATVLNISNSSNSIAVLLPGFKTSGQEEVLQQIEKQAEQIVDGMMDESCEINVETGAPMDAICIDEEQKQDFRNTMKDTIERIEKLVIERGSTIDTDDDEYDKDMEQAVKAVSTTGRKGKRNKALTGDALEQGWEARANASALARNAEVWKFAFQCVFRVLKPRKLRKKGATETEIKAAQIEAAEFIRDGLLELGPSFVKLGQVMSTRTDVLPTTYTDVLKTLTDEVPGFDGQRAKEIVSQELGRPCDEIFTDFSKEPLKAASLGQVHTAMYKGKKVAIKVQRAGLKELFDLDLKNLKKLAILLDKFDPKSDGADRDWVSIYEESERLLYLEIDYLNEVRNAERFAKDFAEIDWVRVPSVYHEVTTPRVLTMEFVESFKLTDTKRVENEGLDRKLLSKRVAESFLRQIVETAYFHADPHSGNLCVNKEGQLVFYDFGQMDELKPNVRKGFRTFCTALFAGGPTISDTDLARNAKDLVKGVEQAGVLSKGADRLAVEKLARYFMRSFKDSQLGKSSGNIKETVGADLQTLTENNSFRFPATFTFVFRAFVSVEGIGKELDPTFDLGKLAQPFLEKFIDEQKGYGSKFEKNIDTFKKATGLNSWSIDTALTQPKKVAYIEETIRAMESGTLKIRVRSLENEKALERLGLRQTLMENLVVSSILFNVSGLAVKALLRNVGIAGGCYFLLQAFITNAKIKKFDKTQLKYVNTEFQEAGDVNE